MVRAAGKKIASTDEEKAAQRQRILNSAVRVFGKYGYHRATMSQVAAEADLGRGTIYWYFQSKSELFRAIIQGFMDHAVMQLKHYLYGPGTLEARVQAFVQAWLEFSVRDEAAARIIYSIVFESSGGLAAEMAARIGDVYREFISLLQYKLDQEVAQGTMRPADTRRVAKLLIGLIDGVMFQHLFEIGRAHV